MKVLHMLAMKVIKKIILFLVFLPFFTDAQVVSDDRQWTNVSVNKKINDFEFSLGEELRLDENLSHIDKIFTEIGVDYKIIKGLSVGIGYRYNRDNDYETRNYDINHRFDLGLTYKQDFLDKWKSYIKIKYQYKKDLPVENNPVYLRNKLGISYDINESFSPYIFYEFYYQFNDEHIINRVKYSAGCKYAINENNALKIYYLFKNRFNQKNLKHNHIWGLSYSIDL